ncbi:Plant invertase/pectin methylesterase inhibitor superfamily protein [Raphanus sativus]|uniref:Pectinesterase inhibitor 11-like n=1 Tax=Raphanus sativus TaxID=3726 RepID=A0A6J0NBY4_RAPSA|nr:pectinesterase inhibitor 11-like [Raphanus sativus]KAJ4901314.1 Plant invertase/pectin methylesterase inhibitor superfamily protein [Raphanus sativus]
MVSKNLTAAFLLFTTFLFISGSTSAVHSSPRLNATTKDLDFIRTSCNVTQYPDICFKSLAGYASTVHESPARLTKLSVDVAITKAKSTVEFLSKLSRSAPEVKDCVSYVRDAIDSMRDCLPILRNISRGGDVAAPAPSAAAPPSSEVFRWQMDDVLTYMTAATTYEETCTDEYEDEEGKLKTIVCDRVNKEKLFSSIALSLANSLANNGPSPRD